MIQANKIYPNYKDDKVFLQFQTYKVLKKASFSTLEDYLDYKMTP